MAVDLSLALQARGHTVELFSLNESPADQRLAANGIRAHDCRPKPFRIPAVPHQLTRTLRRFHADIFHAHSGVWYSSAIAALILGRPLIFTDHGRYLPESRRDILLQRFCAALTDQVVTVSEQLSEYVRASFRTAYLPEVVDNGIDLEPYRAANTLRRSELRTEWGVSPADVVAVMSGRLVPVKNHAGFLQAMRQAKAAGLHAVFLGNGPLESELRDSADKLGLSSRVRFLGFRQDVADCLLAADILAMPSDSEGLPIALIEGMAAGLPIVASSVGGIPVALGDPPAGILVPPRDVTALASALARLTGDAPLRRRLGALGKARAGAYTLERMTDRYERIYRARARGQSPLALPATDRLSTRS